MLVLPVRACRAVAFAAATSVPCLAGDGVTIRISQSSDGLGATAPADAPDVSADGRWSAFVSASDDLVPGDTNGVEDVFVHDRLTGQTLRVSVSAGGVQANGASGAPSLSTDGRFVAFESDATNLVKRDSNGTRDVFVKDLATGEVELASRSSKGTGDGPSGRPSLSGDGGRVAFESRATNLVSGDDNGSPDVFLRDLVAEVTLPVSVNNGGGFEPDASFAPHLSADGSTVAFLSRNHLAGSQGDGLAHVFVRELAEERTRRVSVADDGAPADADCAAPRTDATGRRVVFATAAGNLVPDDDGGIADVFLHDRRVQSTTRVSVDGWGRSPNGASGAPDVSADGRYVAFASTATDLVPASTTGPQVFIRDRELGSTHLVSRTLGGVPVAVAADAPRLSSEASVVGFASEADSLVPADGDGLVDVFLRLLPGPNLGTSYCTPAVANSTGTPASLAASGSDVAAHNSFRLTALNLPEGRFVLPLVATSAGFQANPGGSQGNLCIGKKIGILPQAVGVAQGGAFEAVVDLAHLPVPPTFDQGVQPGETWYWQCWYRDANPGETTNFTDALAVLFR